MTLETELRPEKRVLVTGATGFVGQKIMQMCSGAIACPSLRNASGMKCGVS